MAKDDSLLRRIETLEAREEIRRLMHEYLYIVDELPDKGRVADLFTEDAVYETGRNLGEMPPTVGREKLRDLFSSLEGTLTYATHYLSNDVIDIADDGQSAVGRWYAYEMTTTTNPEEQLVMAALYENTFLLTDEGWRIKHIKFSDILSFPYLSGWRDVRFVSLLDGRRIYHNSPDLRNP